MKNLFSHANDLDEVSRTLFFGARKKIHINIFIRACFFFIICNFLILFAACFSFPFSARTLLSAWEMRHDNLDCFSWFYSKSWDKLLNSHLLCDYEEKTHVTLHIFRSAMLNAYDIPQWQLSAEPLINWSYCLEFGKKTSIRQHFPVIFHQFPQSPLIKMLSNLKSRRLQLAD